MNKKQNDLKVNKEDLPKLSGKEQKCLEIYFLNGRNQSDAWRRSHDCTNSTAKTVWENASKFFNSTKVLPWLKYYEENSQQALVEEIAYTKMDHFNMLNYLQDVALHSKDKDGNVKVSDAIKIEDMKGKLQGLYTDKHEVSGSGFADLIKELH